MILFLKILLRVLALSLLLFSCLVMSNSLGPMNSSMPGLPVPHHLLKFAHVHVHSVSDAIQPSHPLMHCSPSAIKLSLN